MQSRVYICIQFTIFSTWHILPDGTPDSGLLMSDSDGMSPNFDSGEGDATRLFQLARPHLSNMLRHSSVGVQDHEDLLQEAFLGFLRFLQQPANENVSRSNLLPVLIDILKKRISDYRNRNRWKSQSAGGTDAQLKMAAVEQRNKRDTVAEALSTWERRPQIVDRVLKQLKKELAPKEFHVLERRREENPPTLQDLADEMKISIGKVHRMEAHAKKMFQSEFERQIVAELDLPR